MPDAEHLLRQYFDAPKKLINWRNRDLTAIESINSYFRQSYDYQFSYNQPTLCKLLLEVGFAEVKRAAYRQTRLPFPIAIDAQNYKWDSPRV